MEQGEPVAYGVYGGSVLRTAQTAVGATPVTIAQQNPSRAGIVLTNTGSYAVYIGPSEAVNTANGHALLPNQSLSTTSTAAIFALSGTGTNVVTTIEEVR